MGYVALVAFFNHEKFGLVGYFPTLPTPPPELLLQLFPRLSSSLLRAPYSNLSESWKEILKLKHDLQSTQECVQTERWVVKENIHFRPLFLKVPYKKIDLL